MKKRILLGNNVLLFGGFNTNFSKVVILVNVKTYVSLLGNPSNYLVGCIIQKRICYDERYFFFRSDIIRSKDQDKHELEIFTELPNSMPILFIVWSGLKVKIT